MRAARWIASFSGFAVLGLGVLTAVPAQAVTPATPTNLSAVSTGDCSVHLSWDPVTPDPDRYRIDADAGSYSNNWTVTTNGADLSHLPSGTVNFTVRAYSSADGFGDTTTTALIVPAGVSTICSVPTAKPTNVVAQWSDSETVRITWSDAEPGADEPPVNGSYRVCLLVQSGNRTACAGAVSGTSMTFSAASYDPSADPMTVNVAARNDIGVDPAGVNVSVPLRPTSAADGDVPCAGGGTYHLTGGVVDGNSACSGAVQISSGALGIDTAAFQGASALTSVAIPDSVTTIGASAFKDSGLTAMSLPSTLTSIGDEAFLRTHLVSVVVPDSVTSMGGSVFGQVSSLRTATLGAGLTVVPNSVFMWSGLRSVTIRGAVTEIVGSAFEGTHLGSFVVPSTVTQLSYHAFYNAGLTSITLNEGLVSIKDGALASNPGLTSLRLPASLESLQASPFAGSGITSFSVADGNVHFQSVDGVVLNPAGTAIVAFPSARTGSYTIPDSVTSLADAAFMGSLLTSVQFGSGVTAIPGYAFRDSALTSISIPSTVTAIGDEAFLRTHLTSVVVPDSVTSMGASVFAQISSLRSATLGSGMTVIPNSVFMMSGLRTLTLRGVVTRIVGSAFEGTRLGSFVVPSTVTQLDYHAFYNAGLTSIVLPDGLASVADGALASNPLTAVVFCGDSAVLATQSLPVTPVCAHVPDAPSVDSARAIGGTTVELTITPPTATPDSPITTYTVTSSPQGVTTTGELVDGKLAATGLTPATDYTFTVTANNIAGSSPASAPTAQITTSDTVSCPEGGSYHVTSGVVDFNSGCTGAISIASGITEIGVRAFIGGTVTSVVLPDSLLRIKDEAFNGASTLTSITIPDSVIEVGSFAFQGANLSTVSLGAGVPSIGYQSFRNNRNLSSVSFGAAFLAHGVGANSFENTNISSFTVAASNPNLVSIDGGVFTRDGTSLLLFPQTRTGSYTIPDSVTSLGAGVFAGSHLTTVALNANLTAIPVNAFRGSSLTSIDLTGVTTVGWHAFEYAQLSSLTIPASVTTIGDFAFAGNPLTSVTLPATAVHVGSFVFADMPSLTSASIGAGTLAIPYGLFRNARLTSFDIPDSVTTIGGEAFNEATALASVTIPDSVETISDYAFQGTALTQVTLGAGVRTIAGSAFRRTGHLTAISLPDGLQSIGSNAFEYSTVSTIIYCGSDPLIVQSANLPVTPACLHVPDAPTIDSAIALSSTSVELMISPPAVTPDSAITSYTATSSPDGITTTGALVGGALAVTGLNPATDYTFTVTANNIVGPSQASNTSSQVTTLESGLTPQFSNLTATVDGFTATITNFDAAWLWTALATDGGDASVDDVGILTVTGLEPGESSTVTVTSARPGWDSASAEANGHALRAGLIPTFGVPTASGDGFAVQISNFDSAYEWSVDASLGTAAVGDSGLITVSGLAVSESSTVTVTSSRGGYTNESSQVTGSRMNAARTPELSPPTSTASGFTFEITNFSAEWQWIGEATNGGTATISGSGLVTVSGISSGASSTVTITSSRDQYADGTAETTGTRLNVARTPALGTPTATGGGFTVQINNFNAAWQWAASVTEGGTAAVSDSGLVTVTGIGVGTTATVTVTSTRSGYVSGSAEATSTRLRGARTPAFDAPVSTVEGYTVQITNFSSEWRWSGSATNGGMVSISDTGLVTVTGMRAGASADATVTNSRSGYVNGTANVIGSRLRSPLTPTFGAVKSTVNGFTVQITNFDDAYAWSGTATNGGVVSVSAAGLVSVTGMAEGATSKATVSAVRSGYAPGKANIAGTRLSAALTPVFGPVTQTTDGFKVAITNFVAEFTWTATATGGATVKVSAVGVVTVSGLAKTATSTVTVKTSRTGYAGGVATLNSSSLPSVPQMTPEQIAMLTAKDVAAIPATVWASVGASQMRAFTPAAITGLSAAVFKALKPGLLSALTATQVSSLSIDCIKAATKSIVSGMTSAALVGLTVDQIKVLAPKAAQAVPQSAYVKMTLLQQQALVKAQGA